MQDGLHHQHQPQLLQILEQRHPSLDGADGEAGFDWQYAAGRLLSPVVRRHPWQKHASWRFFEPNAYSQHPYYYHGNGPPPTLQDLTAWLWTPETAAAFSLLLLAFTVVACCWFSHKIGEWLCTAVAGFLVTVILTLVILVFVSQWF